MNRLLRLSALFAAALALMIFGTTDSAEAHVCLEYPLSRVGEGCVARSPQKVGPCGIEGRSANVTEFRPGETITLVLNETIDHPSHYRVSFNPNGDLFHDPVSIDDKTGAHPFVLLDDIEDTAEARQTLQVTFPAVACENCTLQLIQVMYDKQGNGFGGRNAAGGNDDLYYACADIVLRGEPVAAADQGLDGELDRTARGERGSIPFWPVLAVGGLLLLGRTRRTDRSR